jgi:hypothetical protein
VIFKDEVTEVRPNAHGHHCLGGDRQQLHETAGRYVNKASPIRSITIPRYAFAQLLVTLHHMAAADLVNFRM